METPTKEEILKFNIDNKYRCVESCKRRGITLNFDSPKTIQDKLNWLNIYDVDIMKSICADKVRLHEYCKDILGEDICIPLIKTYKSTSEIKFSELPNKFVIKCNHGSGMNIIVRDKDNANFDEIKKKLDNWMKDDFAFRNGFESHYHWIDRRILVEEFMSDKNQGSSLYDYKFWCFNGHPKFYTINDGHGHGAMTHFSMDQKKMALERKDIKGSTTVFKQPEHFDKMKELCEKLSKRFKFVRVDLYEINGKIYLGELTFVPGVGYFKYKNDADNERIGKLLNI